MVSATRLIVNSVLGLTRTGSSIVISFILTPFILWKIGVEAYGVWALVNAIVTYAALLDLGIPSSLSKYVAEYNAQNNKERVNVVVNTTLFLFLILGIFSFLVLWLLKGVIIGTFFRVEQNLLSDVTIVFLGALLIFIFNLVFSVFQSILVGFQRIDVSSWVNMLSDIFTAVLTIVILGMGFGLKGLVLSIGISTIFTAFVNVFYAKRIFPELSINLAFFKLSELRHLLKFSLQMYFMSFATMIYTQLDKLLLSYFLGVRFVAYYDIAGKIIRYLRNVPMAILSPVLPAASEIHALGQREKLRELYFRVLKYLVVTTLPIFTLVFIFSYPFVSVWLGEGYGLVSYTLQIMLIGNFINLLTGPGFYIIIGQGNIKYATISAAISSSLNLILSFIFIIFFGYKGVVWGSTLSVILGGAFFILVFHKLQQIPLFETIKRSLFIPMLGGILMWVEFLVFSKFIHFSNYFSFLVVGMVAIVSFAVLTLSFSYFDEYDKEKTKELYFRILKLRM